MNEVDALGVLAALMLLREYPESSENRRRAFPTKGSFEWYIRQHSAELVELGAMIKHRGAWHVHAERFDQAVLRIAGLAAAA